MDIFAVVMEVIREYWFLLCIAAFLAAMFSFGWRKGILRMSFSLVSFLCTIILSRVLLPRVQAYVYANPTLSNWVQNRVLRIVEQSVHTIIDSAAEGAAGSEAAVVGDTVQNAGGTFFDFINMTLGVNRVTSYAASQISNYLVAFLLFVVLLFLSRILLRILFWILDMLFELPVLNLINRGLGAVIGLIEGILYVGVFIVMVGFLPHYPIVLEMQQQLSALRSMF